LIKAKKLGLFVHWFKAIQDLIVKFLDFLHHAILFFF